jgi:hypothetical protein
MEMGVGGLAVKYVLLTRCKKKAFVAQQRRLDPFMAEIQGQSNALMLDFGQKLRF